MRVKMADSLDNWCVRRCGMCGCMCCSAHDFRHAQAHTLCSFFFFLGAERA